MANNRLYLCSFDDDGEVVDMVKIAKHSGGPWFVFMDEDAVNGFFADAFVNGRSIALTDEYREVPLQYIDVYNDDTPTVQMEV